MKLRLRFCGSSFDLPSLKLSSQTRRCRYQVNSIFCRCTTNYSLILGFELGLCYHSTFQVGVSTSTRLRIGKCRTIFLIYANFMHRA